MDWFPDAYKDLKKVPNPANIRPTRTSSNTAPATANAEQSTGEVRVERTLMANTTTLQTAAEDSVEENARKRQRVAAGVASESRSVPTSRQTIIVVSAASPTNTVHAAVSTTNAANTANAANAASTVAASRESQNSSRHSGPQLVGDMADAAELMRLQH